MAAIIGGLNIGIQSGGIFNYGDVAVNCAKNNIHQEANANSFCAGDGSFFYGVTNQPTAQINGIITDIIDGDAAKGVVKEVTGFNR